MSRHMARASVLEDASSSTPIDVSFEPVAKPKSPLTRIHELLRGRYPLAIILALAGLAAGGILGWHSQEPLYKGVRTIRVVPSIRTAEDPTGRNLFPMLPSYVQSQVSLIMAEQTALEAMETDDWAPHADDADDPLNPEAVERFLERRSAKAKARTYDILVEFVDPSPKVAQAGADVLVDAYDVLRDRGNEEGQLAETNQRIAELKADITRLDKQLVEKTSDYGGVDGLRVEIMAYLDREIAVEREIDKLRMELLALQSQSGASAPENGGGAASTDEETDPEKEEETEGPMEAGGSTGEDAQAAAGQSAGDEAAAGGRVDKESLQARIALENQAFSNELFQLALLKARKKDLLKKFPAGSAVFEPIERELQIRQDRVDSQVEEWERKEGISPGASRNQRTIERQIAGLVKLKEKMIQGKRGGATKLENVSTDQRDLKEAREELESREAFKVTLLNELGEGAAGRVRILESRRIPIVPFRDSRLVVALGGGTLGAALGAFLVLLLGLSNRGFKSTRDVHSGMAGTRLLGLLPMLPKDLADPESSEVAVHCVHHLRTLLQIGCACDKGATICVTGPGAGSGKTTLTTALGLSFASSGSRTLIVDCDLVGRGLTDLMGRLTWSHVKLKALGANLVPQTQDEGGVPGDGDPSSHHVLQPLVSHRTSQERPRVGDLCDGLSQAVQQLGLEGAREAGVLDELFALADLACRGSGREELEARLMTELASTGELKDGSPRDWIPPQIAEVGRSTQGLNGKSLAKYLYPTGMKRLHFLPLRGLGHGGDVSVDTIRGLLDRVRGEFDTVLIDTGPVPGTLETPMVAAHAQTVIMVISQGDQRADAERAIEHMQEVGGSVVGVVFNRAGQQDMFRTSMSLSRRSVQTGVE